MTSEQLVQYLINGISDGCLYALIGLGFTIIYSVTNIINFAQGEFVMLGGLLSYMLVRSIEVPTFPTVIVALLVAAAIALIIYAMRVRRLTFRLGLLILVPISTIPISLLIFHELASTEFPLAPASIIPVILVGCIGAALYVITIRPARGDSTANLIIITIGAAMFIRGLSGELWGVVAHRTPVYWDRPSIEFLGGYINTQTLWVVTATVGVTILLQLFFTRTMLGKALKACAVNPHGAQMVGINIKTMALVSFALAAMVGALAGTVVAPKAPMAYHDGFVLGLYGFIAAALGGFKSQIGAVIGGMMLGMVMSVVVGLDWGPFTSGYKDIWAVTVLLVVLLIRSSKLSEERAA